MAMSHSTVQLLMSWPPVRGATSLMFLFLVGAALFETDDLGIGGRIAMGVFVLLLGSAIWVATLRGFVRDLREPRSLASGEVVVAARPRGAARLLSWIALLVLVLSGLGFGALVGGTVSDRIVVPLLLAHFVSLVVAIVLPRLTRWYADGAGLVAVSPDGLRIVAADGEQSALVEWRHLAPVGTSPHPARALDHPSAALLGHRVRWRRGAREAVARWAEEGFAPTAAEVRDLHLEPGWSEEPAAHAPSRLAKAAAFALYGWAIVVCALLLGAMIWAVSTGQASWWVLLLLGWAPALALAVLGPRLLRLLRTDERRSAEATSEGWVDHLHGQGLVPWHHIERIEVRGRHTLVISRADAPTFRDRDLGNRLNHRMNSEMESWPAQQRIKSAGPLFREIGPRHLPYLPESRAFEHAEEAGRRGWAAVGHDSSTAAR